LGPHTVIIGQNPNVDIARLGLHEGLDYEKTVDLSQEFRVEDKRFGNNRPMSFSL